MKNIVELVNCNIGLFQGEEQKSQFMGEIVEILRKLFVYPIVSGDSEILLIVIEILEKFIVNIFMYILYIRRDLN